MDTSKKYIKMCDKLDLPWNPRIGDFCFDGYSVKIITEIVKEIFDESCNSWIILVKVDNVNYSKVINSEELIPLFRQDQLQEMVLKYGHFTWSNALNGFLIWFEKIYGKCINFDEVEKNTDSMEQLWLAFVIYEKYQKIWDDKKEEWIIKQ